jgi:phage-related protein
MRQTFPQKPLVWIASTRKDIRAMPEDVQDGFGQALLIAQRGGKSADAKPLKGYSGAGVLEIIEDHAGDTYRAVYTVRFTTAVYVLHIFQKKSTHGIQTARRDLELLMLLLTTVHILFEIV